MALNISHSGKPSTLLQPLKVALRGQPLLTSPRLNKGTAFPTSERKALGLEGRLPYRVNTLDEQCERAYEQLRMRSEPLRKNTFLQSLKDQNWTLYYSLLSRHLKELVPIIYTPTEADAIANYSHLFRRSEGCYLSFPDLDRMEEDFLEQMKGREIDLVVCTDAEAILGIGDQGVGGIGISSAKCVMYTLVGGIDPSRTLPVMLDVGTNNQELLNDDLYVGWRNKRVGREEYDAFIDKFVQLVRTHLPHSLLHFEDFGVTNAHRILDKYRNSHAVFNDDIQGTGAITLATVLSALIISSRVRASTLEISSTKPPPPPKLSSQRYIIFGAGSAGVGIASQLRDAMVVADGISREEANRRFWLVDREGLLYEKEDTKTTEEGHEENPRQEFYRPSNEAQQWGTVGKDGVTLLDVVRTVKPSVLVGCSTSAGAFTEEIIKTMLNGIDEDEQLKGGMPIVLPLSNPSRLVEAKPEDILKWTSGRALVATGSPFEDVKLEIGGKTKTFQIAECNNALIYPGIGFGAILSQSKKVTNEMLLEGAQKLASLSPAVLASKSTTKSDSYAYTYDGSSLLPDFGESPAVNHQVAISVAKQSILEGSAGPDWHPHAYPRSGDGEKFEAEDSARGEVLEMKVREVEERANEGVWRACYRDYVFDEQGEI